MVVLAEHGMFNDGSLAVIPMLLFNFSRWRAMLPPCRVLVSNRTPLQFKDRFDVAQVCRCLLGKV